MASPRAQIASLLLGLSVLLAGSGLLGTLLGLRAAGAGIQPATLGWVMSAFYVGYVVGAFACPALIRRVGHIRTFAALAALSTAACLLYGLWLDPWAWLGLRLISGISLIGLYMVVESWLNAEATQRRGRLFALYMSVSLMALAAGQGLLLFGSEQPLAPYALAAVLFSLGAVPIALVRGAAPQLPQAPALRLHLLAQQAPAGLITAAISGAVTGAFWSLAAAFAQGLGLDTRSIAGFIAASVLGGTLLQWPLSRLSDRLDRRWVVAATAASGAVAAGLLGLAAVHSPGAFIGVGVAFGGCTFVLYSLAVAQTCDRLPREQTLIATQGLLLVNGLGAALGPIVAGFALGRFGSNGFALALAGLLTTLAVFSALRVRLRRAPGPEQRRDFVALTRTSAVAAEMDPRSGPAV